MRVVAASIGEVVVGDECRRRMDAGGTLVKKRHLCVFQMLVRVEGLGQQAPAPQLRRTSLWATNGAEFCCSFSPEISGAHAPCRYAGNGVVLRRVRARSRAEGCGPL